MLLVLNIVFAVFHVLNYRLCVQCGRFALVDFDLFLFCCDTVLAVGFESISKALSLFKVCLFEGSFSAA